MAEPSIPAHSLRDQGLQALRDGEDTRAIDLLTRAVLTNDRDAEARACLGIAYSRRGLHEQAIRLLRETVELAPDSPNFRFNLGVALDRGGQPEEARAALLETLRLAPDHPQAQQRLQALPRAAAPPPVLEPLPEAEVAPVMLPSPADSALDPMHPPATSPPPETTHTPADSSGWSPPVLNYGQPYGYTRHRAGTIGALGITGYLLLPLGLGCGLFGVVSLILGISAWSMGNRDLGLMAAGQMDPSGRKSTLRGRTSGIVLTILSLLDILAFLLLLVALLASGKLQNMGNH